MVRQKVQGNLNNFEFTPSEPPGLTATSSVKLITNSPIEFYSLFVDYEILDLLVNETNP